MFVLAKICISKDGPQLLLLKCNACHQHPSTSDIVGQYHKTGCITFGIALLNLIHKAYCWEVPHHPLCGLDSSLSNLQEKRLCWTAMGRQVKLEELHDPFTICRTEENTPYLVEQSVAPQIMLNHARPYNHISISS